MIFLYVVPSILTVVGMGVLIVWIMLGPDIRTLVKKKLGFMKSKTLAFVGYDDRYLALKAFDVTPEGALELNKKGGKGLTFFLARPKSDSPNDTFNVLSERREAEMLPPYNFGGMRVFFAHVAKAIATNPLVLTSFRLANKKFKKGMNNAEIKLLHPVTVKEKQLDEDSGKMITKEVLKEAVEVEVLIPFDVVDIKKNFSANWGQSIIDAMKQRWQMIGRSKAKQEISQYIYPLVIVGCVTIAGMVLIYLLTGGVIG